MNFNEITINSTENCTQNIRYASPQQGIGMTSVSHCTLPFYYRWMFTVSCVVPGICCLTIAREYRDCTDRGVCRIITLI